MSDQDWCTIESDPGVFTEMLEMVGVRGAQMVEVMSLDDFSAIESPLGLVFLFKYTGVKDERPVCVDPPADLFFANQLVTNACATQAILSIIFNSGDRIDMGDTLRSFLSFARDLDPKSRGLALGSAQELRDAHNSFARPEVDFVEEDDKLPGGDAFHFLSYVPFKGKVYELDGLKPGPIEIGSYDETDPSSWTSVAVAAMQQRIASLGATLLFNLMAVVPSRLDAAKARLDSAIVAQGGADAAESDETSLAREALDRERSVRDQWREENVRRRHNYVPFIRELFRELAGRDMLLPMLNNAKQRAANTRSAARK